MKVNARLERNRWSFINLVLLCLFSVALASCIVTYTESPRAERSASLPKKDVRIYYHVDPFDLCSKGLASARAGFDFPYPSRENYQQLQHAFTEIHLFSEATPASAPPEKGIYCSVDIAHQPQSRFAGGFNLASIIFLTVLPSYSASSTDLVQFELSVDRELKKMHQYRVTKVRGTWRALLPFAWINFFTPSRGEAFRAVAQQFFLDAEWDGYFKTGGA
jgi:hypothetical protein